MCSQVKFEVTIDVTQCPEDRSKWQDYINIYPVGLSEVLRVNLDLLCECGCEKPEFEVLFFFVNDTSKLVTTCK